MPIDPLNDPEDVERARHIEELKQRARKLTGGEMREGEVSPSSPEVREQFWEQVVAWEEAPWTTNFKQLEEKGVSLPASGTFDDDQVSMKLWEVIHHLASLRVFLSETDHLSDRELYTLLWDDILHEETKNIEMDQDSACHIQLLSGGSDEDNQLYLKYYADEEWREEWRKDYPKDQIPDHEDPPYDRDQYLPQPTYREPEPELGDLN